MYFGGFRPFSDYDLWFGNPIHDDEWVYTFSPYNSETIQSMHTMLWHVNLYNSFLKSSFLILFVEILLLIRNLHPLVHSSWMLFIHWFIYYGCTASDIRFATVTFFFHLSHAYCTSLVSGTPGASGFHAFFKHCAWRCFLVTPTTSGFSCSFFLITFALL